LLTSPVLLICDFLPTGADFVFGCGEAALLLLIVPRFRQNSRLRLCGMGITRKEARDGKETE